MDIIDIAFVGSGAASAITLIELFNKLIDKHPRQQKLAITVIDKYHEFWKGVPYGSRSSINSLTITAVSDFISEAKEQVLFFNWIKKNLIDLVSYYELHGGTAASKWLAENLPLINNGEWDKVYIPRFLFGFYLENKLLALLKIAEEKKLAEVTLIQAEAIDVEIRADGLYNLILEHPCKNQTCIRVKKLVIATGSAPVKRHIADLNNNSYTYINDIYEPLLDENIKILNDALIPEKNKKERNILLIGSNASSVEILYILNNLPDLKKRINKIVVISPTGRMPYHINEDQPDNYPCCHLDILKERGQYDIHILVNAAKKDIDQTIRYGTINLPRAQHVINYTLELMEALDSDAKKIFYGIYGMQLTRLIRRSGPAYKNASEELLQTRRLKIIKGEFVKVTPAANGGTLKYADQLTKELHVFELPFKVIINCTGSDDLENSASRLIYNLVKKNICHVNLSRKGFFVNENFEAAPNLYVIGPLMGGNMNKVIRSLHVENVSKIWSLSFFLTDILLKG